MVEGRAVEAAFDAGLVTSDAGALLWRRGRRRISWKRLRSIEMLKSQGMSNRAIAHRLGVSEKAIRKLVGPSKPADSAQLAFVGITTAAAGKSPASRVPSATLTGDDADLRAAP
jgi:hypothetical protein